ncbi:MAG: gamma-glutamylcyclotransferase [Bacteroidetes bacterium]|nr:MAG: gamma-glutamylcyclotransferase [Bacteroidota bacterium]
MPSDLLFVYGTLMQGITSPIADRFHRESRFLGEGRLPGRLFDLGSYPGATYEPDSPRRVFGHVFQLLTPAPTLAWLDAYEGLPHPGCEYLRREVPVQTAEGLLPCQAYLLRLPPDDFPEIPSGDYRTFWPSNPRHRRFINSL